MEREIVKNTGKYTVIKCYANREDGCYGDIFSMKDDLLAKHPGAEIMEGYNVIDSKTGYCPDDSSDWYDSVEEAEDYIISHSKEEIESHSTRNNTLKQIKKYRLFFENTPETVIVTELNKEEINNQIEYIGESLAGTEVITSTILNKDALLLGKCPWCDQELREKKKEHECLSTLKENSCYSVCFTAETEMNIHELQLETEEDFEKAKQLINEFQSKGFSFHWLAFEETKKLTKEELENIVSKQQQK